MEQATTDGKIKKWDFQLAVSGHGGVLGDAKILNEMISSEYGAGSVNSPRFDANQGLSRLLEAQLLEINPDKRRELVFKIQEIYADEMPAVPSIILTTCGRIIPGKGLSGSIPRGRRQGHSHSPEQVVHAQVRRDAAGMKKANLRVRLSGRPNGSAG